MFIFSSYLHCLSEKCAVITAHKKHFLLERDVIRAHTEYPNYHENVFYIFAPLDGARVWDRHITVATLPFLYLSWFRSTLALLRHQPKLCRTVLTYMLNCMLVVITAIPHPKQTIPPNVLLQVSHDIHPTYCVLPDATHLNTEPTKLLRNTQTLHTKFLETDLYKKENLTFHKHFPTGLFTQAWSLSGSVTTALKLTFKTTDDAWKPPQIGIWKNA